MRRTRLTAEREGELYEAVLDLLREVGYEGLTMDAVAARTHSSKATLYRQWKGKPKLVIGALRHTRRMTLADFDTGSLRGDLLALVEVLGSDAEKDVALMRALAHAAHNNPDLQQAMHDELIEPEIKACAERLERAVRGGEVPENAPGLEFVPHMMLGAMLSRPLIEGRAADPAYLARYVHAVIFPALRMADPMADPMGDDQ